MAKEQLVDQVWLKDILLLLDKKYLTDDKQLYGSFIIFDTSGLMVIVVPTKIKDGKQIYQECMIWPHDLVLRPEDVVKQIVKIIEDE